MNISVIDIMLENRGDLREYKSTLFAYKGLMV